MYKSVAQAHKFHALLKEGKISAKVVHEYDKKTNFKKLPQKVKAKKKKWRRKERRAVANKTIEVLGKPHLNTWTGEWSLPTKN